MLNLQKPEKVNHDSNAMLDVHSVFSTIQGEGLFVGRPATFIRLAGCNLQCPNCDTDYTNGRHLASVNDLVKTCIGFAHELVVITGGEPFRQDISLLCRSLIDKEFTVQVETNGTLPPSKNLPADVYIICSPKTGAINHKLVEHISAYKYVAAADNLSKVDGLPTRALAHPCHPQLARPLTNVPVYLQPEDVKDDTLNKANVDACVAAVKQYEYTLCLQIHKIIGVE